MPQLGTFLFNAQKQGWSESWYFQKGDLSEAMNAMVTLAMTRKRLLGVGAFIEAVRVSDVDVLFDSVVQILDQAGKAPGEATRDTPGNAIYVRVNATALYRRQLWMRGLVDDWIKYDPATDRYDINTTALNRLDQFGTALRTAGAGLMGKDKSLADYPWKTVTTIARGADGNYVIGVPAHGWALANQVRIRKVKGIGVEAAKGEWTIYNVTADSFQIPMPVSEDTPILYRGGGLARKVVKRIFPITGLTYMYPALRKTGKAFFVSRGRRRAR